MTRDPTIPKADRKLATGNRDTLPEINTAGDIAAFVNKARAMTTGKSGSGKPFTTLNGYGVPISGAFEPAAAGKGA